MGILIERAEELPAQLDAAESQFNAYLERIAVQFPQQAVDVFKLKAAEVFARIKNRTPVDTGRARAGWQMSAPVETPTFTEITISNQVNYVVWLEVGSSRQAPQGMLRVTLNEMSYEMHQELAALAGA